ncbi:MAG: HalOD1 output domain-containing protein [Haloarculaceae archaeon]
MTEDTSTVDDASVDADGGVDTVYAEIEPDSSTAEYDLLELIAGLEGKEIEELPSLYTEVDHFVESLFKVPPSPAAQMEIRFSYAGYRVTISQTGAVKLVPVKESLRE